MTEPYFSCHQSTLPQGIRGKNQVQLIQPEVIQESTIGYNRACRPCTTRKGTTALLNSTNILCFKQKRGLFSIRLKTVFLQSTCTTAQSPNQRTETGKNNTIHINLFIRHQFSRHCGSLLVSNKC